PEAKLGEEIASLLSDYESQMEALQFRKAAAALRALWSAGNSYLEEKAPWLEIKTNPEGAALTLRTAMNLIHLYAVVSEPFIPASSAAMRAAFALPNDTATWVTQEEAKSLNSLPAGTPFTVPPVLFAKITDEDLETYKERFGGAPE
ncbi:methionine--tRNA ligase, partial [Streptomyces anthocyanicus]